ncbi:hypothetical protein AAEX37_02021 [Oligella sp. MSHR50489EDL]|uniref:type III-B CRISPR module RAMP protein Cmr1 n=1 Tax=Oligella sp. MSHR50489EDL TaxID=3139409 RepID=UPI003D814DC7
MRTIKAEFEVVTPMFLGESVSGNEINCAERIRGASLKGALRFYFRALNWHRIRSASADDRAALKALHAEESAIFGAAVKDKKGGQAAFLLRVSGEPITCKKNMQGLNSMLGYLLGQGLYDGRKNVLTREFIPMGVVFNVDLILKPTLNEQQVQQISDCLLTFGLLGGLGSRARKGFGSVSITSLVINEVEQKLPQTKDEYKKALKHLIGVQTLVAEPPLTAFSAQTQLQVSATSRDPIGLLNKHGLEMGLYRSFGRNGKVFDKTAEQNFREDHDWAYDVRKNEMDKAYLPERAVFGLPHPYFLSNANNFKLAVDSQSGRRASPLFAHVQRLPTGDYLLVHTLMRSQFLPQGINVDIRGGNVRYSISDVNTKVDWDVLTDFLERFKPKSEDVVYG